MDVSTVIVSHSRPVELQQMLACLRLQDVTGFEVIVVTNTPDAITLAPDNLLIIPFEAANIAAARNTGIAAAKGRFIAFCDDDALPDPGWLRRLLAPFSDPMVGGTGGFTRGRNGISRQWGAVTTDLSGNAEAIEVTQTTVFEPQKAQAPVMIGTNCAFRTSALTSINGFDEVFAYYLDDSDISLRLSQAGWKLAIVPDAQVHHGFAAGPHRTAHRVPTTLFLIGQSKAYFCAKHKGKNDLAAFRLSHKHRLDRHMLLGQLPPGQQHALLETLDQGFAKGQQIKVRVDAPVMPQLDRIPPAILPKNQTHILLAGSPNEQEWMNKAARALTEHDLMVTTLTLHHSPRYMQVRFSEHGYWQHVGGRFGKANRAEPFFRWISKRQRMLEEATRLSPTRPVNFILTPQSNDNTATFPPQIPDIEVLRNCEIIPSASFC